MAIFQMICPCGQVIETPAETRDEAIEKIQNMMDEKTIRSHFREMHPDEEIPSVEDVHAQIEQDVFLPVAA